ncbi:uncharacterized protein LOC123403627 [Hordeum vulgare subsp. vulgare]|uniref:Uncharacterized protein n=1 Tax=Hordeum vulgare subsp. vulgare TaxID=112509 RepID=A0A8I6YUG6_HORVV|nr:uncharacterized protein LOC123403627 [Hordeum vulgare subsp. vulgare]KAI4983957.1 hypothetical protein ZWY2020_040747 [Hordeum vulgare]
MEDGPSDFSDWEVLSAASGVGRDDPVLVCGEGGDVLHDHFALDSSSSTGFSGEDSWSEAASDDVEIESGLESVDRFCSAMQEQSDLIGLVDSSAQLQLGGIDVTAQASPVLIASVACGGGAQEKQTEGLSCGEFDSIPQAALQGSEGILDSHAAAVAGLRLQIKLSENSSLQLEDGGADAISESSVLQAAATSDAMQTLQEEPDQGKDASAGCAEPVGDDKDGSPPLVAAAAPVTDDGERKVVVWWRLTFRFIHYCAWKVSPVWPISIAAALLGIVVLGRRMYRMKRKTQGLPQIKIAFDDKRASQFEDRAARLNEAFLIVKRVPALRSLSGAALPWSMMQER